jgi:hypothetical protein
MMARARDRLANSSAHNGANFGANADEQWRTMVNQGRSMGYAPVTAENPCWSDHDAVTIEDPDGWRAVIMLNESPAALTTCGGWSGKAAKTLATQRPKRRKLG